MLQFVRSEPDWPDPLTQLPNPRYGGAATLKLFGSRESDVWTVHTWGR